MLLRKNNLFSFQRIMKCLYLFCYTVLKYDLDASLDCPEPDRLDSPAKIAIWGNLGLVKRQFTCPFEPKKPDHYIVSFGTPIENQ